MNVAEQWKTLDKRGDWNRRPGNKQLEALATRLPELPASLRELYARANGGYIGTVDVFDLETFDDVNFKQSYRATFPTAVFFASDGGSFFFFIDTSGALECGAGAVMMMNRGAASADLCVPVASDLGTFLEHLARDERPWLGRLNLGAIAVDDMLDVVEASPGKYEGKPYVVASDALLDAVSRCGVQLPLALSRLLRTIDGMRIPGAGVTLWSSDRIEPVPGIIDGQYPGLLWFADDDAGNRYAITPGEWRGLASGAVVKVARDGDPHSAPTIGRLPQVVTGWVNT